MKKTLYVLFMVTLIALLASGCGSAPAEKQSSEQQQTPAASQASQTASSNETSQQQATTSAQATQQTNTPAKQQATAQSAPAKNVTATEANKQAKKNPVVTIEMGDGNKIVVELNPEIAPNTVNNFISLVKKGLYNGLIFHRVIPGFMIQGGDPQGTGGGGPGYNIKGEFSQNGFTTNNLSHTRGVISMARTNEPDTAGSQFFIMAAENPQLDGQYAAFGKVTSGIEEVDKIVNVQRDGNDKPLQDQKMKKVTVETFGVNYPEPQKVK